MRKTSWRALADDKRERGWGSTLNGWHHSTVTTVKWKEE